MRAKGLETSDRGLHRAMAQQVIQVLKIHSARGVIVTVGKPVACAHLGSYPRPASCLIYARQKNGLWDRQSSPLRSRQPFAWSAKPIHYVQPRCLDTVALGCRPTFAGGVERGTALTQRLLAFARRQELRPQAVDACALVDEMRELLERAVGPGVRIAFHVPSALPWVCADSNQLELAILNLAVNARDAMPSGGRLTIGLGLDEAGGKLHPTAPARIFIAVEDTGVGMDEATLARATQPFFTTKGPGKGTGLGLSMVYGLAAQWRRAKNRERARQRHARFDFSAASR